MDGRALPVPRLSATWARRVAPALGALLALAGLAFLGARLWSRRHELAALHLGTEALAIACAVALVHGVAGLLLGLAWRGLLARWWTGRLPVLLALSLHARSQAAKYVPGSVMQYVGRHLLARRAGVPDGALLRSTAHEVEALALAGATVSAVLLAAVRGFPHGAALALAAAALACGLAGAPLVRPLARLLPAVPAGVLALHASWLVIAGLECAAIAHAVGVPLTPVRALGLLGAAAAAWLAGFATPGAPAGLGVRDAVLLALTAGELGRAHALALVVLLRVAQTAGDLVLVALSLPLGRRAR